MAQTRVMLNVPMPIKLTTTETIEKIHHIMLTDLRLRKREIAGAINNSHDLLFSYLNDLLDIYRVKFCG